VGSVTAQQRTSATAATTQWPRGHPRGRVFLFLFFWAAGMPTYIVRYAHIRQLHYRPTNRNGTGRGACTARLRRGRRGPARLGTEGRRHTCHARPGRRAPQVHGNCTIGRQRFNEAAGCARLVYGDVRACSRTDGHTSMQPIGHRRVCTTPASTRPYYPKWCWSARVAASGALAHPCGA
jgi:hypothetical protein